MNVFQKQAIISQPVLPWSSEYKESVGRKIPQSLISNDIWGGGGKGWKIQGNTFVMFLGFFLVNVPHDFPLNL